MKRSLPQTPTLEHLQKEAKELLVGHRQATRSALEFFKLLPRFRDVPTEAIIQLRVTLADAQRALAMSYGYKNWTVLRNLAEKWLVAPKGVEAAYFRDYRWARDPRLSAGRPVGVDAIDPAEADDIFFKFIPLPEGQRVEQYDANGRFIRIVHDPSDRNVGTRKIRYQDGSRIVGAVALDEAGAVRTIEKYSFLSDPDEPHPLVKAEIFNADGRLLEVHTPKHAGPAAEDICVTDVLGKLKLILHHEEINKGEPVKIWEEWPE